MFQCVDSILFEHKHKVNLFLSHHCVKFTFFFFPCTFHTGQFTFEVKGTVHPKMKIQSLSTRPLCCVCSSQSISGASQKNSIVTFSSTSRRGLVWKRKATGNIKLRFGHVKVLVENMNLNTQQENVKKWLR